MKITIFGEGKSPKKKVAGGETSGASIAGAEGGGFAEVNIAGADIMGTRKPSKEEGYTIVTRRGYPIFMRKGKEGIRNKLDEVLNAPCELNDIG